MTSHPQRRSVLVALLMLVTASAFAQAPRIFITGRSPFAFGTVKVGKDSTRSFYIFNTDTNRGVVHAQIIGPATTNFSLLTPSTFEVPPGKFDTVTLSFHPGDQGTFVDSIYIAHDADTQRTKNPTMIRMTGQGLSASDTSPRIYVSVPSLQLSAPIDTFKTGRFIIKNVSDTVRYLSGVVHGIKSPFSFLSGDTAFALVTGDSVVYTVRFAPTAGVSYSDTLHIVSNADTLHRDVTLLLRGTGQDTHPSMSLSIRYIDFGVLSVGSDSVYELTLGNTGNSGMLYDTLTGPTTGPFAVIKGLGDSVLQAKQTMKIDIKFSPQTAGTFQDSVILNTNGFATDRHIVIPVVGIAEQPASVAASSGLMDLRMVINGHAVEVLNPSGVAGAEVSIFDEGGSCRSSQKISGAAVTDIDLAVLPHGSYFVELTVGNRSQIKRIVR